jgi:hypothetical protein
LVGINICDAITPRTRVSKKDDVNEPPLFHSIVLDTYCGLLVKKSDLRDWLSIYGRNKQGYLTVAEFGSALNKLKVEISPA